MVQRAVTREQFGKRLFDLMLERDWTQAELSRQSGLSRDSISKYIRGGYMPDAVNLNKLASTLGVKPEELLPNVAANEYQLQAEPVLSVTTGADPTTSWVKLNRLIRTEGLAELFALLDKYAPQ